MEYKPRIFENAPGQCRFGRREFFGYMTDKLPNGLSFLKLEAADEDLDTATKKFNALLETYIDGAPKGHYIHWRMGSFVWQDFDTKFWRVSARLLVSDYLPEEFR